MSPRLRKFLSRTLPALALLITLLVALFLASGLQQDTQGMSDQFIWVLALALLAVLALSGSIISRIITLVRRVRNEEPGARLAARWVRNFIVLSLPPALIVFGFSAWFIARAIDDWFDVEIEEALAHSLELGQAFLDNRTLEVRNQLRELALQIGGLPEGGEMMRQELLDQVRSAGPTELTVTESDGNLVATANINPLTGLPARPNDFSLLQARETGEYAAAEPTPDGSLHIRVIQRLPGGLSGTPQRFLMASYPLPPELTTLTGSIEREYFRYQNVSYLRESLKQSFILVLTLVLLLTVLLAILAALNAARRMVSPLSRLSRATRDVAGGDFDQQVEAGPNDEIGFLVSSFNDMTQALREASRVAEESRASLKAQGELLESVLGNLSSGVLTLDESERILTANQACHQVLGLEGGLEPGHQLDRLPALAPHLDIFVSAIRQQVARGRKSWQQEIRLARPSQPLVLLMRGTRVPLLQATGSNRPTVEGQVIVFDDVTILNQAQREAAWAEVARRLAHEVKNPLTPIRLAAERLRLKLADKLQETESVILDRSATTIVSQVEALRRMVDAFGDYAREPVLSREPVRIDALIREIVALYQQGDESCNFELELCPGPDGLAADAGRLRQMLHNLIKNATQARAADAADSGGTPVSISVRTQVIRKGGQSSLQIEVADNGPGFPDVVLAQPFEPYVTHKPDGTGLGLAICRKIVSEHDGEISLSNRQSGGARVRIVLPLNQPQHAVQPSKATA